MELQKPEYNVKSDTYEVSFRHQADGWFSANFLVRNLKDRAQFNVFSRNLCLVHWDPLAPQPLVRMGTDYVSLPRYMDIFIPAFGILDWIVPKGNYQVSTSTIIRPVEMELPQVPFAFATSKSVTESPPKNLENFLKPLDKTFLIGRRPKPSSLAFRAKQLIDQNFESPMKISDIANRLNITREALSRSFSRSFGLSPSRYRTALRISEAMNQMGFSNKDVTQAALDAGFDDTGHFIKQFKEYHEATPGKFRFKS